MNRIWAKLAIRSRKWDPWRMELKAKLSFPIIEEYTNASLVDSFNCEKYVFTDEPKVEIRLPL